MADFIVTAVVFMIIGAAVVHIRKEKKKGVTCIGCPSAGSCPHSRKGGCPGHTETK